MIDSTSVNSFFQTHGITGNAMVDGLIVANLIPIIISYIQVMIKLIKKLTLSIGTFIYEYITVWFRSKFVGNELCKLIVKNDSELFRFLMEEIFTPDIDSDIDMNSLRKLLYLTEKYKKEKSNDHAYFRWANRHKEKSYKKFKAKINYQTDDSVLNSATNLEFDNFQTKIFRYKEFFIKIVYIKKAKSEMNKDNLVEKIKITLITFKNIKLSTTEYIKYVNVIENFLNERFNMKKNMTYTYRCTINNKRLSELLKKYLMNGKKVNSNYLLKCSEDIKNDELFEEDINKTKFINKKLNVGIRYNNITDKNRSYKNDLILRESNNDFINEASGNMWNVYKKYFDKKIPAHNYSGYFVKNNKIYLLYDARSTVYINIISKNGLISEDELKDTIEWLIKKAIKNHVGRQNKTNGKKNVYIYRRNRNQWVNYAMDKRSFDTIYLPNRLMKEIRSEFEGFMASEKIYRECQVPYKKGILLYGPPGTGKTSLVKALAYEYQLNIYIINVNDEEINDESIINILNSLGGGLKILLFEDIDSAFADKEKVKNSTRVNRNSSNEEDNIDENEDGDENEDSEKDKSSEMGKLLTGFKNIMTQKAVPQTKKKHLTYSGLLQALDGIMSNQHSVITIMTTNYISKLGKAFIRPGRIDTKFELRECNDEQIEAMVKTIITRRLNISTKNNDNLKEKYTEEFIDEKILELVSNLTDEWGNALNSIKPCELQYYLLKYISTIDPIFENYEELLENKNS